MQPDFLPDSLAAWLALVVQFVGTLWAAYAFTVRNIRKPLEDDANRRFAQQGERLGAVESGCASNSALAQSHEKQLERLHLEYSMLREQSGRQDERLGALMTKLEQYERERLAEDRQISVALARLEEQMRIMGPLAQALVTIAQRGLPNEA